MKKDTSQMSKEELMAYVQELEASTTKNKTKAIELRVTEEDGLFQIRHLTSQAINLQPSVVRWLIDNASEVLKFLRANTTLLTDSSDSLEVVEQKTQLRKENLSIESSVVRPKKNISWRKND
jgi:hypothetical protein